MMSVEVRLNELGIALAKPKPTTAKFKPCVTSLGHLFVSGQLPIREDGSVMEGVVGGDVDMSMAKEAARRCAIGILAKAQSHLGSLDRIKRCVWVGGMVYACTGFRDHPAVINEVSQLFLDVFGEAGQYARVAFGVGGLPFNAPVEVQALFELQ
jgi:enamine deaminase RidA (YjgF/YER057c/UK114 family)